MKKKITTLLLVLTLFFVNTNIVHADTQPKQITILNQNVAGLPIPSIFNEGLKSAPVAQKQLGQILNKSGYDIVCVQEDFQYHDILDAQMTNYKYKTITSGGVPKGDGLNIYSKYPIYNVIRVTWKQAYGVLDNYSDELAPKGFLKVTIDVDGTLIDVYNIHHDAGEDICDVEARTSQYKQITAFIKNYSKENPVIIVGDFNAYFHNEEDLYKYYINQNGFTDAWVKTINNNNYFNGSDAQNLIDDYNSRYPDPLGYWDSVERLMFKASNSVEVSCSSFVYKDYTKTRYGITLTDHCATATTLVLTKKLDQSQNLYTQIKEPIIVSTITTIKNVTKSLTLIAKELAKKR